MYPVIPTIEAPRLGLGFDTVYFLGFDTSIPPFDSLLIRKAIASAIDRNAMVEKVSTRIPDGRFLPATNFTPPDVLGLNLNGEVGYTFNPDLARQLMAEAGYPNGEGFPTITLHHRATANWEQLAREVSDDLHEVLGINVNLATFEGRLSDLPSFYVVGWVADYIHPHDFLYNTFCGTYNRDIIGLDEFWDLINRINAEEDPSVRKELILEFSNLFCPGGWDPLFDFGPEYKRLLDQAMDEADYTVARMLYAQAEIILVETNAFIVPLYHGTVY